MGVEESDDVTLTFPDLPRLELDQLLGQLIDRAQEVVTAQSRLRGLVRANQLITGQLSLPGLLREVVHAAAELVGAEHAALAVIAEPGGPAELVHTGMPDDLVRRISTPPAGAEPSGVEGDLLRVPIRNRDQEFGTLYLIGRTGEIFSIEDGELAQALAATATIAIENARLYEAARSRGEWLQATAAIARALLTTSTGDDALRLIAERCRTLAGADLVTVARPDDGDRRDLTVEVAVGSTAATVQGTTLSLDGSPAGQVFRTGQSLRLVDPGPVGGPATGPMLVVPLHGSTRAHGVISVGRAPGQPAFSSEDLVMAAGFANQAAIAIELAQARAEQERAAMLDDRERIAADLHDHVIQRIFAAGLALQAVVAGLGPGAAGERIRATVGDLDTTINQIRTAIFKLQETPTGPPLGVRRRLLAVGDEVAPALGFGPAIQFSGVVDTLTEALAGDATAVLRESLSNVARHARAHSVDVEVVVAGGRLTLKVRDDGVGLGPGTRRSGLANLRRRAVRRGGTFSVKAVAPGTLLVWSVPLP